MSSYELSSIHKQAERAVPSVEFFVYKPKIQPVSTTIIVHHANLIWISAHASGKAISGGVSRWLMNAQEAARPRDTQALFEKLFASLPDAIVVVDRQGHILEVNPQVESLFGYASTELFGSSVEILLPERFRPVHPAHRSAYCEQPHMRPMGIGPELYGRRKDGSEFPVGIMLSPVETKEGLLILGVIRDLTEQRRLEEEMVRLALSDPLTGLGNYRRLEMSIETETKWFERTGRSAALLLLDLDGLKQINDSHGHNVGSHALCRMADALRAECRTVDTATRHGGDEFTIVLPDSNAESARNLAHRLAVRLANDGGEPPVYFSYGIGIYPHDGKTLYQLLAVADGVLYEMKKSKSRP